MRRGHRGLSPKGTVPPLLGADQDGTTSPESSTDGFSLCSRLDCLDGACGSDTATPSGKTGATPTHGATADTVRMASVGSLERIANHTWTYLGAVFATGAGEEHQAEAIWDGTVPGALAVMEAVLARLPAPSVAHVLTHTVVRTGLVEQLLGQAAAALASRTHLALCHGVLGLALGMLGADTRCGWGRGQHVGVVTGASALLMGRTSGLAARSSRLLTARGDVLCGTGHHGGIVHHLTHGSAALLRWIPPLPESTPRGATAQTTVAGDTLHGGPHPAEPSRVDMAAGGTKSMVPYTSGDERNAWHVEWCTVLQVLTACVRRVRHGVLIDVLDFVSVHRVHLRQVLAEVFVGSSVGATGGVGVAGGGPAGSARVTIGQLDEACAVMALFEALAEHPAFVGRFPEVVAADGLMTGVVALLQRCIDYLATEHRMQVWCS